MRAESQLQNMADVFSLSICCLERAVMFMLICTAVQPVKTPLEIQTEMLLYTILLLTLEFKAKTLAFLCKLINYPVHKMPGNAKRLKIITFRRSPQSND